MQKKYVKKIYFFHKDAYAHRSFAMRKCTGDYVYMILEQDMEIHSKDFVQKLVRPLMLEPQLTASFTREYSNSKQHWVNRFLSSGPSQNGPLFEYLTPSVSSTIVEKKKEYSVCKYEIDHIPTTTHMLFRVNFLKNTSVWNQKKDFDHDTVIKLVKAGYQKFAYVPSAGIYHYHVRSLNELIKKNLRNLDNHYFPYNKSLPYKWVDFSKKKEVLKLFLWVIYANLFFPAMIKGFLRFLKHHDPILLAEPIIVISITDAILYKFFTNKVGRKLISKSIRTIFLGS